MSKLKRKLVTKVGKEVSNKVSGTNPRNKVSPQVSAGARNSTSKQVSSKSGRSQKREVAEDKEDKVEVRLPEFKVIGESEYFILVEFPLVSSSVEKAYWVLDKKEYHTWSAVFTRDKAERCFRKIHKKYSTEIAEQINEFNGIERQHKCTLRGREARKEYFTRQGYKLYTITLENPEVTMNDPKRKPLGKKKLSHPSPPVKEEKKRPLLKKKSKPDLKPTASKKKLLKKKR